MKKKIYVIPHTHWDREWMFSEQTGNVLLNQTINEMLKTIKKQKDFKMVLDGQVSLLDDYLNWNENSRKEKIQRFKESHIAFGPWFSQPDVFSSLGETTIRNLEIGRKTLKDLGLKTIDTAYMPDTFGFNQNLPQIFKQNGLNNFVHWRGLNREHIKNFPLYNWEGVDGTKILSSNYKTGYYFFGTYYPYSGVTKENIHELAKEFFEKTKSGIEESFKVQKNKTSVLFPLGGDQAPAIHGAKRFFEVLNE
ncbi:polysaccharide deacetylase family protein, partial [Mycoplasma marinum]